LGALTPKMLTQPGFILTICVEPRLPEDAARGMSRYVSD
jgi:hypothetical protein